MYVCWSFHLSQLLWCQRYKCLPLSRTASASQLTSTSPTLEMWLTYCSECCCNIHSTTPLTILPPQVKTGRWPPMLWHVKKLGFSLSPLWWSPMVRGAIRLWTTSPRLPAKTEVWTTHLMHANSGVACSTVSTVSTVPLYITMLLLLS